MKTSEYLIKKWMRWCFPVCVVCALTALWIRFPIEQNVAWVLPLSIIIPLLSVVAYLVVIVGEELGVEEEKLRRDKLWADRRMRWRGYTPETKLSAPPLPRKKYAARKPPEQKVVQSIEASPKSVIMRDSEVMEELLSRSETLQKMMKETELTLQYARH